MSTALASATSRFVAVGVLLVASALAAGACGGATVEDQGSGGSGGAGSATTGGASGTGGELATGGIQAPGGLGGADSGCSAETVDCDGQSPGCTCPGVFEECPFNNVHCDADANGEPHDCICGEPDVLKEDCEYILQHRCEPPTAIPWTTSCTCDPVLPTDDEPCRYYQEMYDSLREEVSCSMVTTVIEPEEQYKYFCYCD